MRLCFVMTVYPCFKTLIYLLEKVKLCSFIKGRKTIKNVLQNKMLYVQNRVKLSVKKSLTHFLASRELIAKLASVIANQIDV